MTDRLWYRGFGLCIASEIALPEFLPGRPAERADITVRLADAAEPGFRPRDPGLPAHNFVPSAAGGFVMEVPETALFAVRDGREIRVALRDGHDAGMMRLFLVGSAMGMALHQRGQLVMHGATVLTPGGTATLFVGDSGAGKSTLAAALGRAGMAILGDDTMPVRQSRRGFEVWPGSLVFKLWSETLTHLGESRAGLEPVQNRAEKFFWRNPYAAPDRPVPLTEIVHLAAASDGSRPTLRALDGIAALRLVSENTYRPHYVPLLGREDAHFRQCAALAASVRVAELSRPRDLALLDEGLALLESRWRAPATS